MKKILLLAGILLMTACAPVRPLEVAVTQSLDVPTPAPTEPAPSPTGIPAGLGESTEDLLDAFAFLPPPACNGVLTPSQAEGPYYTSNTPERISLLEEGMQGEMLILIGYVLDADCRPIPGAWLDFWQAGADGEYDNLGYTLRGHQYTDAQGRYYLETVLPGLYSSRPIEHIHVKVKSPNGQVFTTQLYFPSQPIDGLTVQLTPQEGFQLGIFNFVIE